MEIVLPYNQIITQSMCLGTRPMLLSTYWETEADVTAKGLDVFFGAVESLFGLILSVPVSYLQLKPTKTVKITSNAQNKVLARGQFGSGSLQPESLWGDFVTHSWVNSQHIFLQGSEDQKYPHKNGMLCNWVDSCRKCFPSKLEGQCSESLILPVAEVNA